METHPIVTPFGPLKAPTGNVIRPERFARPIPHKHLRLVEETPPNIVERMREDEPRGSDGWWIAAGFVSALFWMAAFWIAGAFS